MSGISGEHVQVVAEVLAAQTDVKDILLTIALIDGWDITLPVADVRFNVQAAAVVLLRKAPWVVHVVPFAGVASIAVKRFDGGELVLPSDGVRL